MVELRGVLARGLKLGRKCRQNLWSQAPLIEMPLAAESQTSVAEAMRISNQFED